ncbi:MAG: ExbD/TolR family protein [Chromatiales bacterium]
MNFRRGQEDSVEINVTSLIDVVLLLLIFFMVSTTFLNPAHINLTLPSASASADKENPPKTLEITVDKNGQYFVNGRALLNTQEATLRQGLIEAAEGMKDPPLRIHADAGTTHQSVITVLDVARQLGWVHISFATEVRQGEAADAPGE